MEMSGIALIFVFLVSLLTIVSSFKQHRSNSKKRRPPGPWGFPLIGSIHHVVTSSQPLATLRDLAEKHGPVMYLRLGQIDNVVISSLAAAQEVMQDNDLSFASRPNLILGNVIFYGTLDIAFAPYSDYWRAMRKLCALELLSVRKVRQFAAIRHSETMSLIEEIRGAGAGGEAVYLRRLLVSCTNSISGMSAFGDGCSRERKQQFVSAVHVALSQGVGLSVSDLFPSLWFMEVLTGTRRQLWRAHRLLDDLFNEIVEECEARWKERKAINCGAEDDAVGAEDNLLSTMLKVRDDHQLPFPFNNTNIKAILLDLLMAGTETTSSAAEWVMAELMRHPGEMAKAQEEVREAFNNILPHHHESHIDRLHYTRMVIKETLRLHPSVPLIPRLCRKTCEIGGFEVTKGYSVMINLWAIGRSSKYGDDAEEFRPMRFANCMADYSKGTEFGLPFGGGRRICPGLGFAVANLELMVARLLYYFDWNLPGKTLPEELNMETIVGATAKRRHQLQLVATPYDVPINI